MAVAAATDNRCVGGGNGASDSPVAVLSSISTSSITSDGQRRHGRKNTSRSSIGGSGYSSSSPPLSSDEEEGRGHVGEVDVVHGSVAEFGGHGAVVIQPPPVAAKRLKYLQQHVVDLDDLELLDRHLTAAEDANADCAAMPGVDMADELKQKTKDLVLAARLGKALLAKNDELSLMNERLAEEYGDKLEEIEQDRHRLRRQLAQARSECEQRCHELQADLKDLQAVLDNRERQLREAEKQKRLVVRELTDQNGRLQSHIRELSQTEAELQNKCRQLEDSQQSQHASGKWNNVAGSPSSITNGGSTTDYGSLTPDDYRSLDVLRDEIDMKAAEKQRLQKRMSELRADRDRLSELLELKDRQLVECRSEANHYEHRSTMLAKQLDDALRSGGSNDWKTRGKCVSCQASTTGTTAFRVNGNEESQPMSLLAELEQAEAANSQTVAQPGPPQMVDVDLTHRPDFGPPEVDAIERWAIRLCDMLEQQRHSGAGSRLLELSADIRYRLIKLIGDDGTGGFIMAGDKASNSNDLTEQIRNRDGRVAELMCELSVRDAELQASREERDIAIRDKMDTMRIQCARCGSGNSGNENTDEKNNSSLIPELLRKAWEQRDGAVRRKNSVQVQLARTRVDVLQANGQLMEAIGQKVELSQQLEQWQTDMQCLLDEQMRRKLLPQTSINGSSECSGGGNQKKFSATGGSGGGGGFSSMTASSLGSLGSSSLMNSLLMIAGGGNTNR